jgi:glycosyltransferase involved in cell wall biosynthesis
LPKFAALPELPRLLWITSRFRPDVIVERYYNFAGAGVLAGAVRKIPVVLEVNAPLTDPPGSLKSRVDRYVFRAMRRWAIKQARMSRAIVTPLASTVPAAVARGKINELPWGANVEKFRPELKSSKSAELGKLRTRLGLEEGVPVAVFVGSFRAWHGVAHFAEAARRLLAGGARIAFLAIGGGPELEPLREQIAGWNLPRGRFVLAGPQPHESIPDLLSLADIGVAPFDLAAHPPLAAFGFYWSPLKIFEYMAAQLPVVTVDVTPLDEIVRHEQEGLLYQSGDVAALVRALLRLTEDESLRCRLGVAARRRVVARYSWQAHVASLQRILERVARGA